MVPFNYKIDFEKCVTTKDFEEYLVKYYGCNDNPYLDRAKQMIAGRAKQKHENGLSTYIFMFVCALIVSAGLIILAYNDAGVSSSSDRKAYAIIAGIVTFPGIIYTAIKLTKAVRKEKEIEQYD